MDSTASCFAEDTRIFLGIKDEDDTQMPQNDLHYLYIFSILQTTWSSMPTSSNFCDMEKNGE